MAKNYVCWIKLKDFCEKLLVKQGLPSDEAEIIALSLVEADSRGVSSHGVSRMKIYMKRIDEGVVKKKCNITIERESPGMLALNAHNSMGIVAGIKSIEMAKRKAETSGSVFVTVKHSNHFGPAAFFTKHVAKQGMIGLAASNAPPNMAPWGARDAYLGTNPLSIAIPTGDDNPIILDMATSVVAQGKIILAAKNHQEIPEGWAITSDGKFTTNPQEALKGTVLPFGGAKGYGIALLIDILSGILSGAEFGPYLNNMWEDFEKPQNLGHIFHVIDISKFLDLEFFYNRINILKRDIKGLNKAEGIEEVYLPGEIEFNNEQLSRINGIILADSTLNDLQELADKWNIPFDIK